MCLVQASPQPKTREATLGAVGSLVPPLLAPSSGAGDDQLERGSHAFYPTRSTQRNTQREEKREGY